MPRTPYTSLIASRTARLKLEQRRKPYWVTVVRGIALGYRRTLRDGSWIVRAKHGDRVWTKVFAVADDYEDSNKVSVLTHYEATRAAIDLGRRGQDSVGNGDAVSLERQIAMKAATFIRDDIEPVCCLYRHYDPAGDLLYVGISLSPMRRHEKHFAGTAHRHLILQILIEPFASREEALKAEERAIREEFPKFNTTHNRRRHPSFELRRMGSVQP